MINKKLEKDTRKLFHELHTQQAKDKFIYHRLVSLLNTDFLKVEKHFFKNKVCLDAGCGSNANATISMINMGAKMVFPMDLDNTIFEILPKIDTDFKDRYQLTVGSVLEIPFEDNFFDFTHCAGVLHHTSNVKMGISELVRVTKPGGLIVITTYGHGGIIRDIVSMLREKYKQDKFFTKLVDNLSAKDIQSFFQWSFLKMQKNGDDYAEIFPDDMIEKLFDDDLVLTMKDRICSPVYHENTQEELEKWLQEYDCKEIQRLKRYPLLNNFRRFLAPMYDDYDSEYARLLYGDGNIALKVVK